jgi:outer membrane biosynthesis protein TonB
MMLSSRKSPSRNRPEQSGYTLALAVLYSFFLHASIVGVALFVHFFVFPKAVLLPAYHVKLVGLPKVSVQTPAAAPAAAPAPAPPKKEKTPAMKPSPKSKKEVVALKKITPKKDLVPDLTQQKKTPAPAEQTKSSEAAPQKSPAVPAVPAAGPATTEKKSEGVDVTTPQQDFKYSYYIDTVTNQIKQNWNPPLESSNAKARVIFKVNRSGWVVSVDLDKEHSKTASFSFQQAALRAIRASNPFPPLPEEYFKQSLEFTVDLIPED